MFFDMNKETCEALERIMEGVVAVLKQCGKRTCRVIRRVIPV